MFLRVPGDRSPPTGGAGVQCVPAAHADPQDWCNWTETLSTLLDGSDPPSSRQTCSLDPAGNERSLLFISHHCIIVQVFILYLNVAYLAAHLFSLQLLVAIWERLGQLAFKCSQFLQRSSDTLFTPLPILHTVWNKSKWFLGTYNTFWTIPVSSIALPSENNLYIHQGRDVDKITTGTTKNSYLTELGWQ